LFAPGVEVAPLEFPAPEFVRLAASVAVEAGVIVLSEPLMLVVVPLPPKIPTEEQNPSKLVNSG